MWLATEVGFFSVVRDSRGRGLLVRARVRADLERFVRRLPGPRLPIVETPRSDYPFRIVVPARRVARVVARLVASIDYPNFKNRTEKSTPGRHDAYLAAWAAFRRLEGPRPVLGPSDPRRLVDYVPFSAGGQMPLLPELDLDPQPEAPLAAGDPVPECPRCGYQAGEDEIEEEGMEPGREVCPRCGAPLRGAEGEAEA